MLCVVVLIVFVRKKIFEFEFLLDIVLGRWYAAILIPWQNTKIVIFYVKML